MTDWRLQILRFAVVGLISNSFLFFLYLLLTSLELGHKSAMTLLFVAGMLQTFVANKHWVFDYEGGFCISFSRYALIYFLAYFFNLAALLILVDFYQFPHQLIQGVVIFVVAPLLFLLQRYWVFRATDSSVMD
ncbi:GtrA-like protein [Luminiphilus syltensis NOR5-1B]|uniref:GtrA-like protein n=1 Tax=Luminiphilus syltensis NOR5-1B TaxID=565045 RepID=B8KR33_9GAMM|nr:GtrA family protein [Luminiphilus syltensis]EED34896.1 GtrA-like protein [Luminiphilus syltensis NOR5-1B]